MLVAVEKLFSTSYLSLYDEFLAKVRETRQGYVPISIALAAAGYNHIDINDAINELQQSTSLVVQLPSSSTSTSISPSSMSDSSSSTASPSQTTVVPLIRQKLPLERVTIPDTQRHTLIIDQLSNDITLSMIETELLQSIHNHNHNIRISCSRLIEPGTSTDTLNKIVQPVLGDSLAVSKLRYALIYFTEETMASEIYTAYVNKVYNNLSYRIHYFVPNQRRKGSVTGSQQASPSPSTTTTDNGITAPSPTVPAVSQDKSTSSNTIINMTDNLEHHPGLVTPRSRRNSHNHNHGSSSTEHPITTIQTTTILTSPEPTHSSNKGFEAFSGRRSRASSKDDGKKWENLRGETGTHIISEQSLQSNSTTTSSSSESIATTGFMSPESHNKPPRNSLGNSSGGKPPLHLPSSSPGTTTTANTSTPNSLGKPPVPHSSSRRNSSTTNNTDNTTTNTLEGMGFGTVYVPRSRRSSATTPSSGTLDTNTIVSNTATTPSTSTLGQLLQDAAIPVANFAAGPEKGAERNFARRKSSITDINQALLNAAITSTTTSTN